MSAFDEKMYEFITQPDNWQVAKEIYDRMPAVKEQVVNEFWEKVEINIASGLNLNEWKVVKIEKYEKYNGDFGLCVTRPPWNGLFHIGFGQRNSQTYLAVWSDSAVKEVQGLHEQLANDLSKLDHRLQKDEQWFPAWFYTGDNFGEWSTTDRILPHNRNVMVEKYISMLFELTEKAKVVIDDVVNRL